MQTGDAFAADRAFHQEFTGFDSEGNFLGGAKGDAWVLTTEIPGSDRRSMDSLILWP